MRRLLNVAFAALSEGLTTSAIADLVYELRRPFDSELTEEERRREEYRREAVRIGAWQGQEELMKAMGMKQATA